MRTGNPTPVHSHAGRGRFRDVYEPAEDSFLLLDALEKDAGRLQLMRSDSAHTHTHTYIYIYVFFDFLTYFLWLTWTWPVCLLVDSSPGVCVEVGSGSGVASAFLASIVGPSALYMWATLRLEHVQLVKIDSPAKVWQETRWACSDMGSMRAFVFQLHRCQPCSGAVHGRDRPL